VILRSPQPLKPSKMNMITLIGKMKNELHT
jgi:hypothetical protein